MAVPLDTPELVRRALRTLQIATVVLYAALILASGYFWWDARQTKHAVCAFRTDLQVRVDASEAYLVDHPDGFLGIPAAQIRSSIDGQRRTIVALAGAGC